MLFVVGVMLDVFGLVVCSLCVARCLLLDGCFLLFVILVCCLRINPFGLKRVVCLLLAAGCCLLLAVWCVSSFAYYSLLLV